MACRGDGHGRRAVRRSTVWRGSSPPSSLRANVNGPPRATQRAPWLQDLRRCGTHLGTTRIMTGDDLLASAAFRADCRAARQPRTRPARRRRRDPGPATLPHYYLRCPTTSADSWSSARPARLRSSCCPPRRESDSDAIRMETLNARLEARRTSACVSAVRAGPRLPCCRTSDSIRVARVYGRLADGRCGRTDCLRTASLFRWRLRSKRYLAGPARSRSRSGCGSGVSDWRRALPFRGRRAAFVAMGDESRPCATALLNCRPATASSPSLHRH